MIQYKTAISAALIFGGASGLGSSNIMAQSVGLEYTTEWQSDFKNNYDWLNLLQIMASMPICNGLDMELSTISTAKTAEQPLISDMLTFSNIEAGNISLTFARLGFAYSIKKAHLFVGINNVNEDYFTSDLTSYYTNSSCGISPTISCNYDIANYPLAAWCIHYRQELDKFSFQTSLYPGQGYNRILGHNNLFNLDINKYGLFSISSIDYKHNGIYCILGIALHYGMCMDDVNGEQEDKTQELSPTKSFSTAPWILTEIDISNRLALHAHASFSTVKQGCKSYAGIGLIYKAKNIQPGVALNYASFSETSEFAAEIACRIPINDKIYLQPAMHLIKSDSQKLQCVGMMRMHLCLP